MSQASKTTTGYSIHILVLTQTRRASVAQLLSSADVKLVREVVRCGETSGITWDLHQLDFLSSVTPVRLRGLLISLDTGTSK